MGRLPALGAGVSGAFRGTLAASMIELEAVSKYYGRLRALDRVTVRVRPGATTVLMGSSGCGKSTALRAMIGLIQADRGRVLFDGQPLSSDNILEVRRRMGYVIQEGGLFAHLSAGGNVALAARYLGWSEERVQARLQELADLMQLRMSTLSLYPVELSGGQRQRVSLMRAMMMEPEVLLLDEPLGALDPIIRNELQYQLRTIFRKLKQTVVLVTHDVAEASFFGDHLVLLRGGEVVQQGDMRDLLDAPAEPFVAKFISAQRRSVT